MTVSTHIEGTRLTPLWYTGHIQEGPHGIDQAAKDELPVIRLHHLRRVTIKF